MQKNLELTGGAAAVDEVSTFPVPLRSILLKALCVTAGCAEGADKEESMERDGDLCIEGESAGVSG